MRLKNYAFLIIGLLFCQVVTFGQTRKPATRDTSRVRVKGQNVLNVKDKNQSPDQTAEIRSLINQADATKDISQKISKLEKAKKLAQKNKISGELNTALKNEFKDTYNFIIASSKVRGNNVTKIKSLLSLAYSFCQKHSSLLDISNCKAAIAPDVEALLNFALRRQDFKQAKDICSELPVVSNCYNKVYTAEKNYLLDKASASRDFDEQRNYLLKARGIVLNHLNNNGIMDINLKLREVYQNEFNNAIYKAKGNDIPLDERLSYLNKIRSLCGDDFAPRDCNTKIEQAQSDIYSKYIDKEIRDIAYSKDYDKSLQRLTELERMIKRGNVPAVKLENVKQARLKVHRSHIDRLLADDDRSYTDKEKALLEAEEINAKHLSNSYNYKIQQRRNVVVSSHVDYILYNLNGPFSKRLESLNYALDLANQVNTQGQNNLRIQVLRERRALISNQYNKIVNRARQSSNWEDKMAEYDKALSFCNDFSRDLRNNDQCENLQRERRNVISTSYRSLLTKVKEATASEDLYKTRNILDNADQFFNQYTTELSYEKPISVVYQEVYNSLITKSKAYENVNNFNQARSMILEAQTLEKDYRWITPGTTTTQALLVRVDRKELDYNLGKVDRQIRLNGFQDGFQAWDEVFNIYQSDPQRYTFEQQSKLSQQFNTLFTKATADFNTKLNNKQYNLAVNNLDIIQPYLDADADGKITANYRSSFENLSYTYYKQRLDDFQRTLKSSGPKSSWISEMDGVVAHMSANKWVDSKRKSLKDQTVQTYTETFTNYVGNVLGKIKLNDFNTDAKEEQIRTFWNSHDKYVSERLFKEGMGAIAFLKSYRKAKVAFNRANYEESTSLFQESLTNVAYAPTQSRSLSYQDSVKVFRDQAFSKAINLRMNTIDQSALEADRIGKYRSLSSFMQTYNIPLSASQANRFSALKESVFGERCSRNTQQYFDLLDRGEAEINKESYTSGIRLLEQAVQIANETPECDLDDSRAQNLINRYEDGAIFEEKTNILESLRQKAFSTKAKMNFNAYQEAYRDAFDFYQSNIINKGYSFSMIPYREAVRKANDNDFWSFVITSNAKDDDQLYFVSELLRNLVKTKSFSEYKLEVLSKDLATVDYQRFGRVKFSIPLERYDWKKVSSSKRYKAFKKTYRKQFNDLK